MDRKGITASELSRRIRCDRSTVSRILRGLVKPDWRTMRAIEKATRGRVTPNDFRDR